MIGKPFQELHANGIASKILHFLETRCSSATHLHQIQAQIILHNLHCDATIDQYFISACQSLGLLHSAFLLFTIHLQRPESFVYNHLIRAFSHSQAHQYSTLIYSHMHNNGVPPNHYTFPFILKSLSDLKSLRGGQCLHNQIVKLGHFSNIYVQNSLLNLYASCGNMVSCRNVFDEMPQRDVVSWTVMIMGYRESGKFHNALIAFDGMQNAGVEPNQVTMVNALGACGCLGALDMGLWIHGFVKCRRWKLDVILGTSLIDMYGKCGRIEEGLRVFQSMEEKNVFTWNALIKGLALAKSGQEAVSWFSRMEQGGVKPDEVTLIAVLTACVHSGLVEKGQEIFSYLINGKYGFSPGVKHYACAVDLLSRLGHLEDSIRIIEQMPFKATKSVWVAFLSGCKAHGNLELTEFAARKLIDLEPENCAYYIVLSNLYAEMGKWSDVEKIRILMKERELKKDLGSSSVKLEYQENLSKLLA